MRQLKYIILSLIVSLFATSCESFLDTTPEDLQSPDKIFEKRTTTESYLYGVYAFISNDVPWFPWQSPVCASSADVDFSWTNYRNYNLGVWSASDPIGETWNKYYQGIREATYFMHNVDKCPSGELRQELKDQYKAEARALRAYFYFSLMKSYGPVIVLGDELADYTKPSA